MQIIKSSKRSHSIKRALSIQHWFNQQCIRCNSNVLIGNFLIYNHQRFEDIFESPYIRLYRKNTGWVETKRKRLLWNRAWSDESSAFIGGSRNCWPIKSRSWVSGKISLLLLSQGNYAQLTKISDSRWSWRRNMRTKSHLYYEFMEDTFERMSSLYSHCWLLNLFRNTPHHALFKY